MNIRLLHSLVLIWVVIFGVGLTDLWAFSFGGMTVKSEFGDRLEAEIELTAEPDSYVEVVLGNDQDYKRLEIPRNKIIDDLKLKILPKMREGKRIIQISSDRPMFYPSLNLVLKASQGGGTLIENFLISVDFRQSLALNVKDPKKKKPLESTPRESADFTSRGKISPDASEGLGPELDQPNKSLPSMVSRDREDASMKDSPVSIAKKENSIVPSRPQMEDSVDTARVPPRLSGTPAEDKGKIMSARFSKEPVRLVWVGNLRPSPSGAIWVQPRILGENMYPAPVMNQVAVKAPPQNEPPAKKSVLRQDDRNENKTYGPLKKGETLFSVVAKLKMDNTNAARIAVALWLGNPEEFVYKNMHRLREGSRLDLTNLRKRLAGLDSQLAQKILKNQWEELKLIEGKSLSPNSEAVIPGFDMVRLPFTSLFGKEQIFSVLKGWKQTWEEKDLDQHMAYFSSSVRGGDGGGRNLKSMKQQMFDRFQRIRINALDPFLIQRKGRLYVSFEQNISSDTINSFGRKNVEVTYEDQEWRILGEQFRKTTLLEREYPSMTESPVPMQTSFSVDGDMKFPFVIHASSHVDLTQAMQSLNELRKQGFNAYTTPVNVSPSRMIYRVYVGRFPSWSLAEEQAIQVRRGPQGKYAIPVQSPYTLQAGVFGSEKEAQVIENTLISMGYSPFLFISSEDDFFNPSFRVLLGAFGERIEAERLERAFKNLGISYSFTAP